MNELAGKHIVLGLTGGVACYKSAELCRSLIKAGATVQVVMTESAEQFITKTTMQSLSGRPVYTSQWDDRVANNMAHIELSRQAHAVLIAPCSADFAAKLIHGRADDLLSLMCLARPRDAVPLLIAPAMNREMWAHPATQRNMAQLEADGAVVLGVGQGEQACGETGDGRMLEPDSITEAVVGHFQPKLMGGQSVLITAGPTFEALDPVRGLTNRSSGKMGFALARAARDAGARVTLVSGPVALATPDGVDRVDVDSAQQMFEAVTSRLETATVFIACAAVADWRAEQVSEEKVKKQAGKAPPTMQFVENPDILATVAMNPRAQSGDLFCVGFAAESHDLMTNAKAKRERKGVPLLIGNIGPSTFGRDDNTLLLVDAKGTREIGPDSKLALSRLLIQDIAQRLKPPAKP